MGRLYKLMTSIKVSALLMAVLALLFLLNVALPQERLMGKEVIDEIAAGGPLKHFVLITLGFGNMPSSPIFIAAMALFFVNLAAVLVDRARATARRVRAKAPSAAQLRRRAQSQQAIRRGRPEHWDDSQAVKVLRGLGYRVQRPADGLLYADKNRRALLGFMLFHLSFFPLLAGGLMLYYTRNAFQAVIIEGQQFDSKMLRPIRTAPMGGQPDIDFTLLEVEPRYEAGEPTQLLATVQVVDGDRLTTETIKINDPLRRGDVDILVKQVGVAPALRVLDRQGKTVDLVAAPAPTTPLEVRPWPIIGGALEVEVDPIRIDPRYRKREQLAETGITLSILERGGEHFRGTLRQGEFAQAGEYTIKLEEVRFWVRLTVVSERGGWVLIGGFVLGVVGLVWRMLFVRREVGVAWTDDEVVLFGTSEFYKGRFRDDLDALASIVVEETAKSDRSEA